jgi:hypothetical protein
MVSVTEKYTTKTLSTIDPVKEKDKMELSNDAYAITQLLETLINVVRNK